MLLSDLPEPLRPHARVLGTYGGILRKASVTGIGILQGIDVAYVNWDRRGHLPASQDTVVVSSLLVLDAG